MVGGTAAEASADTAVILGTRDQKPVRLEIDVPSLFGAGASEAANPIIMPGDVGFGWIGLPKSTCKGKSTAQAPCA